MANGHGIETAANGAIRHDGEWANDEPVRRKQGPAKRHSHNKSLKFEI